MLSISAMANGQGGYYLGLAREDYYVAGGEPPGRWDGSGAARLGLAGEVTAGQLTPLFEGFAPPDAAGGGGRLVANAGSDSRQPGWDLTFSAPKSVSVYWAQADAAGRAAVQAAQAAAVAAALRYLDEECGWTRRGKGGTEVERCGLVAALFEHGTSRAQDPNLHTHALVLNVGVRADGTTGTVLSKPFYEHKMAAGAVYRAELAHQLQQRLGLACWAEKTWFELAGVPKAALDAFSTRRGEIEAALGASGRSGARAAEVAALATRSAKECRPRADLSRGWQAAGRELGFGPDQARSLEGVVRPAPDLTDRLRRSLAVTAAELADAHSHFTERDLLRRAAEAVQTAGVPAEAIRAAVKGYLHGSPGVVRLDTGTRDRRYTTADLFAVERELLRQAEAGRGDRRHDVPAAAVDATLAAHPLLNAEQAAALRHITAGGGTVRLVSGLAGTGKTTLLDAARDAWERGGRVVVGAALAGKAAQELEEGAHIPSGTIHSRLFALDKGRLALTPKSVVVVDEAGMAGTRVLARLTEHVRRANALLVLVGDHRQLQSIDAGGAFKALGDRLGRAELTDIRRQRDEWAREAVRQVVRGDAAAALRQFADRGLLTVCDDRSSAARALTAAWADAGVSDPKEHLIFAGENRDAALLNRLCQAEREARGYLEGPGVAVGGEVVRAGDRVLFTRNFKPTGVKNGNLGTVTGVNPATQSLRVRLDGGREVSVLLAEYADLRLGYAVTTHKGQGATVDHAYVLAGGSMTSRELAYVQLSRSRHATRVYAARPDAGEGLADLARAMTTSRLQTLAHDAVPAPTRVPEPTTEPLRPEVTP